MTEAGPHRRLWPDAGGQGDDGAAVAVLTHQDGSELVLPLDNNAVAAAPLIRITGASTRWDRARRRLVWAGVRTGAVRPLLRPRTTVPLRRDDRSALSLHEYLETALSERNLSISVSFGPMRTNQKPVVRVMRRDGDTVAFAKVGWTDLTAELVRHEARFLAETSKSPIPGVRTPQLLHVGEWRGSQVAVFSPELASRGPRMTPEVFRAVSDYVTPESPAVTSDPVPSYDAETLAPPWSEVVAEACVEWVRRWGGVALEVGRWHGDWTPWNTGGTSSSPVILWDWERTEPNAPVGFDPLNYSLQPTLVRRRENMGHAIEAAGADMDAIGVPKGHQAPIIWWYTLEVIARHARVDNQSPPRQTLQRLGDLLRDL
jgi:hypothetical protein